MITSDSRSVAPSLTRTAKDVASLAGVSQSAVSRAFSADASISPEMKRRVLLAAETLGYSPNLIARSLITNQSRIVGVAVGDLDNPFFADVLRSLSERLSAAGYRILMFTATANAEVDAQMREILRYRVDALILMSSRLSSELADHCQSAGIPVLFINRVAQHVTQASSVTGDNAQGAAEVARFLLASGRRRLAFVAGYADSSTSREREIGFIDQLCSQGTPVPLRASGDFTREGAVVAARQLLGRADRPDAIFCANDHMAIAVLETARAEFGIDVGRELSIVGYDDIPMAAWPSFSLTTVRQPVEEMVDRGVELLLSVKEKAAAPEHIKVSGRIIVRGSAPERV